MEEKFIAAIRERNTKKLKEFFAPTENAFIVAAKCSNLQALKLIRARVDDKAWAELLRAQDYRALIGAAIHSRLSVFKFLYSAAPHRIREASLVRSRYFMIATVAERGHVAVLSYILVHIAHTPLMRGIIERDDFQILRAARRDTALMIFVAAKQHAGLQAAIHDIVHPGDFTDQYVEKLAAVYTFPHYEHIIWEYAISTARNLLGYVLATRKFIIAGLPAESPTESPAESLPAELPDDIQDVILVYAAGGKKFTQGFLFVTRRVLAAMRNGNTRVYGDTQADNSLRRGNFLQYIFG